jgi:hydrogenase/urease accessory protein HupE
MKSNSIVFSTLALSSSFALAHPGHEASALHLHVGVPGPLNTINPLWIAVGLFAGALCVGIRILKGR